MKRDKFNIVIYKGETYNTLVSLKNNTGAPISLTGATITAEAKSKSTNATVFTFVCSVQSPATGGEFMLSVPAAGSANLTPQKNLSYDVKIAWAGGDVKYWLGGDVEIRDTVTP
jgi:hypothetical protein